MAKPKKRKKKSQPSQTRPLKSKKPKKVWSKKRKPKPRKRKKAKKLTRKVFEKRPRKGVATLEVPEGFDINLAAANTDEAYATIEARLQDAQIGLPEGYQGRVLMHAYADGSVDGELYVNIPEGMGDKDAEFDAFEAFSAIAVGQRYWISFGARYSVQTDDERYRRFKGQTQVQTNYQRANQANIVEEHLILRNKIIGGMTKRFGEQATSVFIRLHWNLQDEQPKR